MVGAAYLDEEQCAKSVSNDCDSPLCCSGSLRGLVAAFAAAAAAAAADHVWTAALRQPMC
jgi:hypothetical protein